MRLIAYAVIGLTAIITIAPMLLVIKGLIRILTYIGDKLHTLARYIDGRLEYELNRERRHTLGREYIRRKKQ